MKTNQNKNPNFKCLLFVHARSIECFELINGTTIGLDKRHIVADVLVDTLGTIEFELG